MNGPEVSLIQERLPISTTLAQFKAWLESWVLARHPDMHWGIFHEIDETGCQILYWHVPNKLAAVSRIEFGIAVQDAELLETNLTYADDTDIKAYVAPLLQAIKQRWLASQSVPDFTVLVQDVELAKVLRLRWEESKKTYAAGAYLSTIILLGSILEGVLLAKVQQNPREANQASGAPKEAGKVRPFSEWTLENLITVAHECGWLENDARDYAIALRDYRNLVHPRKQATSKFYPDADTCHISWPVVIAALSDLKQ